MGILGPYSTALIVCVTMKLWKKKECKIHQPLLHDECPLLADTVNKFTFPRCEVTVKCYNTMFAHIGFGHNKCFPMEAVIAVKETFSSWLTSLAEVNSGLVKATRASG